MSARGAVWALGLGHPIFAWNLRGRPKPGGPFRPLTPACYVFSLVTKASSSQHGMCPDTDSLNGGLHQSRLYPAKPDWMLTHICSALYTQGQMRCNTQGTQFDSANWRYLWTVAIRKQIKCKLSGHNLPVGLHRWICSGQSSPAKTTGFQAQI